MARFEFRLKTLLTLRQGERERCRAELAAAYALARQVDERRRALEAQLEQQREWVRAGTAPGTIAVEKLRDAQAYEAALRADRAEVVANHQSAAAEVGRCQQAVAAAESDVRALEKLRERQLEEYLRRQALVENQQSDELRARRPLTGSVDQRSNLY